MAHGASRNFAALSWYAGASAPGSINVRPMHGPIPPPPPSLSITLSLSRSREDLPPVISVDLSCLRRNASFFPLACSMLRGNYSLADRDANHSITVWPRRRKDQTGATWHGTASYPEIQGVLEKSIQFGLIEIGNETRGERERRVEFTRKKTLD